MIRARVLPASKGSGALSTTKRNTTTGGSKRKNLRKRDKLYTTIFVVFTALIIIYCTAGLYYHSTFNVKAQGGQKKQSEAKPPPKQQAKSVDASYKLLADLRSRFNERYKVEIDGKSILDGPMLLEKGLYSFGSIDETARRILDASEAQRPFVMAFSGYSITVGRGNFYNQSFPFVAGRVLEEPMREIFGIPLTVRNAAIGGIPSFPYGFCLDHFLGVDPDVISWDYLMNENGGDPIVLESFVRQATAQLPKRPMVIMVETNRARMDTLNQYTKKGWLRDAIAIGKKDILNQKDIFGDKDNPTPEEKLPAGFQKWNEFGSPKYCPGRGAWHPKKQEHAMMGWIIAMHFIDAMEKAVSLMKEGKTKQQYSDEMPKFSKPLSKKLPVNDPEVTELLFGHPKNGNKDELIMKQLSCRTSFLPATDHSKTMTSVVVSGLAEGDLDIMVDRTDEHYKEGWVLDVSHVERDTKRKVEACGGLGYVDMKIALYGIPESGKIRLWLPFEGPSHDHHDHHGQDANAKHWFDDFILCEANDKRKDEACKLDRDLELVVGGVEVASELVHPIRGAAEYLKRTTCVNVGVPLDAVVTPMGEVQTAEGKPLSQDQKAKLGPYEDDALGMIVDVTAKSGVTRQNGACCLSHIVWEQH